MAEVSIQLPSDVCDTFGRLNYKPWYALAELGDDATENCADHQAELHQAGQKTLHVDVRYDNDSPAMADDANGQTSEPGRL